MQDLRGARNGKWAQDKATETTKEKRRDNLARAVPESERARIEPQGMGTALQNHPEEARRRQNTRWPHFWSTTLQSHCPLSHTHLEQSLCCDTGD